MTNAEVVGLGLVALSVLLGAVLTRNAWLASDQTRQRTGFALLAGVAYLSPPVLYFLFAFRDGLGPDAELSHGFESLAGWFPDAWPILALSALLVAVGVYLVRRAA